MGFLSRASLLACGLLLVSPLRAAKLHTVSVASGKIVPYSAEGDPSGAQPEEKQLHVRPLMIDGKLKEWTTGEWHDVTDRSFVIRRALRINDALPGERSQHWVWQRGPWLLIDRTKGTITALHLPLYEPTVSNVVWFRDYAAYCGLGSSGKQLYAVVAQLAARKPILVKKLSAWNPGTNQGPACLPAAWQREPLQVTFEQTGSPPVNFDLVGLSAVLVEDGDGNDDSPSSGTASQ